MSLIREWAHSTKERINDFSKSSHSAALTLPSFLTSSNLASPPRSAEFQHSEACEKSSPPPLKSENFHLEVVLREVLLEIEHHRVAIGQI